MATSASTAATATADKVSQEWNQRLYIYLNDEHIVKRNDLFLRMPQQGQQRLQLCQVDS